LAEDFVQTNLWQNRAKLPNWKITRIEVMITLLYYSIRGSMKYGNLIDLESIIRNNEFVIN